MTQLALGFGVSQSSCWPAVGGIGLAMAGCRATVVLGLVSASWQVDLYPRVSGCRALGVLGLASVHRCVMPGPEPSGGQDHVLWETF